MGFWSKLFLAVLVIVIAFSIQKYRSWSTSLPRPDIDEKFYWGRGDGKYYKESAEIRPFKVITHHNEFIHCEHSTFNSQVDFSATVIDRLKAKLDDAPKAELPLEGVGFQYGFNGNKLNEIVEYWSKTYLSKWSERQSLLNQYPQFKTQIQG